MMTMMQPTILTPQTCKCQSCQQRGPFAWLAFTGTEQGRQPLDWLCLHCLELGYAPQEFVSRVLLRHGTARFVLFPATSLETEYEITPDLLELPLAC